jgi:cytochrome P450
MNHATYPPGPRSYFPGQTAFAFRRDVLGYLTQLHHEYGDAVSFSGGGRRFFVFYHPDQIRDVLITHESKFIKGPALRRAKRVLGEGLLTSEHDFHMRQRRLAQPALHPQRVATYAAAMVEHAERLSSNWQDGQIVDMHQQMMQLTLSIVCKTLFDADVQSEIEQIGRDMDRTVRMFTRAMTPMGRVIDMLPLPSNFRFHRARKRLWNTVMHFVEQRRAGGDDRGDLLSMLLRATDPANGTMSDLQLRDELITLFTAGYETTANTLAFTWYLLSQNPIASEKLQQEWATVLGDEPPTAAMAAQLPYTRAVISETMRLYPPAWAIGREAIEPCRIGEWDIPQKSVVLISQWVTHRDERFWSAPQMFDPDRWLQETDRPRFAYFPFGGGARSCIGEAFAWMEAILLTATIGRHWKMVLLDKPPVPLQATITLRPLQGIRMRLSHIASPPAPPILTRDVQEA